jgi:hypothetical protein
MDRNIITVEEAAAYNRARIGEIRQTFQRYETDGTSREAWLRPGTLGGELIGDLKKSDTWYERILKYVPVEAVSMYLALDRGIAASGEAIGERVKLLALALLCSVAFNVAYLFRVAGVRSQVQVWVSSLALVAYVYVNGGVFNAIGWANPTRQLFVLVMTGAVLTFFKPPMLAAKNGSG